MTDLRRDIYAGQNANLVTHPHRVDERAAPVQNPAGITVGDRVDVLLERGGFIDVVYAGTSGSLLLFRLDDSRLKGFASDDIHLIRRAS